MVSELIGTFFFVSLYMINVDPMQQFTKDKVKICMGIAASYCGAKLLAGGTLTTGIKEPDYYYPNCSLDGKDTSLPKCDIPTVNSHVTGNYKNTGPLLNTSLAFG